MRVKIIVAGLVVAVAVYMVIVGYRGLLLIGSGDPIGIVLGSSVLVLPATGCYVLYRELQFGRQTARLAAELQAQGRWPTEVLPTRPSGRPRRDAADELFQVRRLETQRSPEDWCAWYRLGLAYEDAGDRKRARQSLRHSISLYEADAARPAPRAPHKPRPLSPGGLQHPDQRRGHRSSDDHDEEGRAQ
jgi:hypothetical protein